MGYKSTTVLTREQAEKMYVEFKAKILEKLFMDEAKIYNDQDLCAIIENMKDRQYEEDGYTNFDNFVIGDPNEKDYW